MKIFGTIVEYNPLHNGHVYHYNQIPKKDGDIIIAAMSSSLVNRGEISTINKFDKTKLALELGIDIIIEIPSIYTIQSGEVYAKKAIELLNLAGASDIYIGSENNNIDIYEEYYNYMNTDEYNDNLKRYMDLGNSYKSSSQMALNDKGLDKLSPNDILGLFYYKAIKDNNYNMSLHTIKRTNDYSSTSLDDDITSATSIRLNQMDIEKYVPKYTYDLYKEKGFIDNNKIFSYLKLNIINNDLNDIFLINEGFENNIKNIYKYDSYKNYLESLNTKRYSITKIQRIMLMILFNIKKDDVNNLDDSSYLRILGYSSNGGKYLNIIKHNVKIYTNIKEGINNILDIEMRISKILDTIYNINLLKYEQKGPTKK